MTIAIITKITTTNNKNNSKYKTSLKIKKTPLISDISENLCPQNVPVLSKYKYSKYWQ